MWTITEIICLPNFWQRKENTAFGKNTIFLSLARLQLTSEGKHFLSNIMDILRNYICYIKKVCNKHIGNTVKIEIN